MEPKRSFKNMYEYELENGLRVIYFLRPGLKIATSNITYHVGSRNEGLGVTGATHYLEHGMFKGSKRFNKALGNGMWELEGLGAVMNATTYLDRTNYYSVIQSKYLGKVIEKEADRMFEPLLTQELLDSEMTVVRNELERGENNDFEVLHKRIIGAAFLAHPYGHSTIGWRSDVENVSAKALRKFHDTYYIPNNATYTVVGNFDVKSVTENVLREFGKIKKGVKPPKMYTEEPTQMGQRRVVVRRPSSTSLMGIAFKACHGLHRDAIVLKVLSKIMSAPKTNPFENMKRQGIVHDVMPSWERMKDPYVFVIWVTTNHASEDALATAEVAVFDKLKSMKLTSAQLEEAKKLIKNKWNNEMQSTQSIAMAINEAIARGDAFDIYNRFDVLETVTVKDLYNVASKFTKDKSTVGWFLPGDAPKETFTKESYELGVYPRSPQIFNLKNSNSKPLVFDNISKRTTNGNFTRFESPKTYAQMSIDSHLPHTPKNVMTKHILCQLMTKGVKLADSRFTEESIQNFFNENDISRSIHPSAYGISVSTSTSTKDTDVIGQMVSLMKGEMYTPSLQRENFEYLKRKIMAETAGGMGDVNDTASILFSQALFNRTNANHRFHVETLLGSAQQITYEDLKKYHKLMFEKPSVKTTIVSSDLDVLKKFTTLPTTTVLNIPLIDYKNAVAKRINKHMDGKASCTVKWGHLVPDSLPLKLGIAALGGGFTGRLMQIIRDQYGLTYGIYARLVSVRDAHIFVVSATFAPSKLEEGLDRSEAMIKDWASKGISEEELKDQKVEMEGSFDVQFDNTGNVVHELHKTLLLDQPIKSLDEFKSKVRNVTLEEVNEAIANFISVENMTRVVVGSIKNLKI